MEQTVANCLMTVMVLGVGIVLTSLLRRLSTKNTMAAIGIGTVFTPVLMLAVYAIWVA